MALIYLYTFRAGIKTVVWTDTLQTVAMLLGAGLTVWLIARELGLSGGALWENIVESPYSQIWVWDWQPASNFFKSFISGAAIATVMTGLDQDMMQKNLTIKTLPEAQRNVLLFSVVLVLANLLFLSLGTLLYQYAESSNIAQAVFEGDCAIELASGGCIATDQLFPYLALNHLGPLAGVVFIIGIIAAAYSSADSALTALTTSFCLDILDFDQRSDESWKTRTRYLVHVGFAGVLFAVILIFEAINDRSVISSVLTAAGYTYGPLLGLYAFGLYVKRRARDQAIPWICLASPILSYLIAQLSPRLGYTFGFEILLLNGLLTFVGLWMVSKPGLNESPKNP
ncbi:MAG: hypothetical protein AAF804_14585 [Bacteroidota bacterium]